MRHSLLITNQKNDIVFRRANDNKTKYLLTIVNARRKIRRLCDI